MGSSLGKLRNKDRVGCAYLDNAHNFMNNTNDSEQGFFRLIWAWTNKSSMNPNGETRTVEAKELAGGCLVRATYNRDRSVIIVTETLVFVPGARIGNDSLGNPTLI